jgi:hypothetical protein
MELHVNALSASGLLGFEHIIYSILFHYILFYSILFCSILLYSMQSQESPFSHALKREKCDLRLQRLLDQQEAPHLIAVGA